MVLIPADAMTDLDIQELANLTAGDADVDNFERLFTKLKEMKGNWENSTLKIILLLLLVFVFMVSWIIFDLKFSDFFLPCR